MESKAGEEINEEEQTYFFDTYAIVEIIKQNPAYESYTSLPVTLTLFNLGEIYFVALRDIGDARANTVYAEYRKAVVEIDDETFKEAVKFRKTMNKRQLSYADCIGYIYAKRHSMKFLTGDPQFENLDNVEFVK